ncbi:MAG: glycosyltransferase family 2 protein [Bacteroidetes bacterium]|nr:MAG: glycosyltransferase family 2 protein [Bacteroidota bacterium]
MQENPELSIIIVSYNVRQLLLNCIQSIIDTTAKIDYEIIVVDNASNDGGAQAVKERFPELQVIANKENVGFASANNQGYAISKGGFLLLLNPDTLVKPDAIKSVLDFIKSTPDAGMAGCRLLNPDGTLQKSICRFPSVLEHIGRAFFVDRFIFSEHRKGIYYRTKPFEIDYCAGAFMMIRREALGNMPLLSPEFFMYAEEKDLALRLKEHDWKTYFVPQGEVIHFGEQSTKQMAVEMFLELQKSQVKFYAIHHKKFIAWLLSLSWGLVLISTWLISLPLLIFKRTHHRLKLLTIALLNYPKILKIVLK